MLVRLQIVTDRHPDALVVPKRSLRREGELNLVFAIRDGRARRVEVEEGFSDDTDVEIVCGAGSTLEPGDLVVVVGNRELEDGGEVVVEAPPAATDAPSTSPAAPEEPAPAAKPAGDEG